VLLTKAVGEGGSRLTHHVHFPIAFALHRRHHKSP
jgi:hypothetical protein